MADGTEIGDLTPVSSITGPEVIPLNQSNVTMSATPTLIKTFVNLVNPVNIKSYGAVCDYGSTSDAVAIAAAIDAVDAQGGSTEGQGGTVVFNNGSYDSPIIVSYEHTVLDYQSRNPCNFSGESGHLENWWAKRKLVSQTAGPHATHNDSLFHLESRPVGSGSASIGDYGLTVSMIKKDYQTTTAPGMMTGIWSAVLNGGGNISDSAAHLAFVRQTEGCGYGVIMQADCQTASAVGALLSSVTLELGVNNQRDDNYIGFDAQIVQLDASASVISDAFLARNDLVSGSSWKNLFRGIKNNVDVVLIKQDGSIAQNTAGTNAFGVSTTQYGTAAGDPSGSDVPAGTSMVWRNSSNGEVRVWVNVSGTLKKSAVFT